jgi:3'(2'), 5'-bisphosphate nucleotidase
MPKNSVDLDDPRLIDGLTALVSDAAAAVMAISSGELATRLKADQSPVTAADEASDATIAKGLSQLLPGIPVVSEERQPPSLAPGETFALVDPLDGTKEFLAGNGEFAINLALIVDGQPQAGFIAAPALGLVYRGVVGCGAERLHLAAGAPPDRAMNVVAIKTRARPAAGMVAVVSRSHLDSATDAFLNRLPLSKRLSCGSALKLCQIAEGAADVYPRLAPISEWDIAAGHAIIKAAGGVLAEPDGGSLTYGRAGFRVPAFVAWGDPAAATGG